MAVLGFIGVGRMGGPMASRLLDAGYYCACTTSRPTRSRRWPRAAPHRRLARRSRLARRDRADEPADAEHRADGRARRAAASCHGSKVRTMIDLSTTGPGDRERSWRRTARERGIDAGRFAGQRRRRGREGRHARGDGVLPEGDLRARSSRYSRTSAGCSYTGEKPGLAQTAKLANNLLAAAAMVVVVRGDGDGRQGRPRSARC